MSRPDPARAVRDGAARALAEVLRARSPDLAVEVTFGQIDRHRRPGGDAPDTEALRLGARGDDADAPLEVAPPLAHPDDAESAA